MPKPYAESCDQNKDPIFSIIERYLVDLRSILEIGSGTGQHAVYFAQKTPYLTWYTSDRIEYHEGICQWLDDANLDNVNEPIELDVSSSLWPVKKVDAVYSANTTHIMHWEDVEALFKGVGGILKPEGVFLLYGPFNFDGQFTSESNKQFDNYLKMRDSKSGIRSFEELDALAQIAKLEFSSDYEMPNNNRILVWKK